MTTPTASQTVGPYFTIGLGWRNGDDLACRCPSETPIEIGGKVLDGDGEGVSDAMIEVWQANPQGIYPHPADPQVDCVADGFVGAGRATTDSSGEFRFRTVKPGRVPAAGGGLQAPHICLAVFARGLLRQLNTRLYFSDEAVANAEDDVLLLVPEARRDTLIASAQNGNGYYRMNIRLQGPGETVFFDF
jgi:protocatechuate 3,4-dioxygenase, alpha subunit